MEKEEYDKINELESFLSNYDIAKATLKSMELELSNIAKTILGSVDYSKESSGHTNKFNSEVENLIARKETLTIKIGNLKTELQKIDLALAVLNETEYKIVENQVMKGRYYYEFIDELNVTDRKAQLIKKGAIKKMVSIVYC